MNVGLRGVALLVCVSACASEGEDETSIDFEPGPSGRAAGIVAKVRVGEQTLTSNEIEIELRTVEEMEDAMTGGDVTPRSARVDAGPHAVWRTSPTGLASAGRSRDAAVVRRYEEQATLTAAAPSTASCDAGGLEPGTEVESMGTVNGRICFQNLSYGVGSFGAEESVGFTLWYTPEGIYQSGSIDINGYFPPDFAHVSVSTGAGCLVVPDEADEVSAEWLGKLKTLSLSFSAGPFSAGYTFFGITGEGFQRGIAFTNGLSASAGLFSFFPLGLSAQIKTVQGYGPKVLTGYGDACVMPLELDVPDGTVLARGGNALTVARDGLASIAAAPGEGYRGALREQMATSLGPVASMLGEPTGEDAGAYVPAASNADWFGDFLERDGTELCSTGECAPTSIDGVLRTLQDSINEAEEMPEIFGAAARAVGVANQGMPEPVRQAALQSDLLLGVELALELGADIEAERRGDTDRYVADHVVELEVAVGEEAILDVTAQEVADLIGVDADALEGATVIYDAEPTVERAEFPIEDGVSIARLTPERSTKLLLRVEVDLSTAEGPLPEGAQEWVVRPALRVLRPEPGPPAVVYLGGPAATVSGAPVSVGATVLDEDFNVVDEDATVELWDPDGMIATAEVEGGNASVRFTPEPIAPVLEAVDVGTLELADGDTRPGILLRGSGFSRDVLIEVDGESIADYDVLHEVDTSERIYVDTSDFAAGKHRVTVINPGGLATDALEFET